MLTDHAPFPLDPVLVAAGATVATRSIRRAVRGWKRYKGNAKQICRHVLDDCWNGRFVAGSAGHFRQFWIRDLAMCTPSLVRQGWGPRVLASLEWALAMFEQHGSVTTTIFAGRYPRDVYDFASDSLPMLLYAIRETGAGYLVERHQAFLSREVERYVERVLDPELGLARPKAYFSAPRDCIAARSTTFAATMIALLEQMLEHEPRLPNPLKGRDIAGKIVTARWTGDFFRDAHDHEAPSGDGNLFPFLFRIFADDDLKMRRRAFATLEQRGFSEPLPLRYFEARMHERELPVPRWFTPNYQGDTSWMQLGPLYLACLRHVDEKRANALRDRLAGVIERDGNYLELYDRELKPYRGRAGIYQADEGMIWASLFLDLYASP